METFYKQNLRNRAKESLKALSEEYKKNASQAICQHLRTYIRSLDPPPSSLLGFIPFQDEPDLNPFYREVRGLYSNLPVGFPRVQGRDLVFHQWTSSHLPGRPRVASGAPADSKTPLDLEVPQPTEVPEKSLEWQIGALGTIEPSPSLPRFGTDLPWGEHPLVLVPGRVFDRQGGRIGRGKGYYDRFLRSLRKHGINVTAVGICFFIQVVQEVPRTEQDEAVDHLITEEGVS